MSTPEFIRSGEQLLGIHIPASFRPEKSKFFTGDDAKLQCGLMTYTAGTVVDAHVHKPVERHFWGTQEILMVRKGRSLASIYDDERRLICTKTLEQGDVLVLLGGGHGFRMLEETEFVEVKQGPYAGMDEKERFGTPE
jgi:mannose-6-phosphate isomerase-like protein (cupin superfamily)